MSILSKITRLFHRKVYYRCKICGEVFQMREGEIEQLQDHILESHKDMFRVAVLGHYLLPDDSEIQEDFLNELIKHFQDEQANN